MKEIIKKVFDKFGTSIMCEGNRFCAIVDDMAVENTTERKIIHRLCDCQLLSELYESIISNDDVGDAEYLQFYSHLREEGFSEEWICIICTIFELPNGMITKKEACDSNQKHNNFSSSTNDPRIICINYEVVDSNSINLSIKDEVEAIILRIGVKHIKKNAFVGMANLKYIYISETVQTIGKKAFSHCPSLSLVEIERSIVSPDPIQISNDVFQDSPKAMITIHKDYYSYLADNNISFVSKDELEKVGLPHELFVLRLDCVKVLKEKKKAEETDRIFTTETKILKNSNDDYFIPKGYPIVDVSCIQVKESFSFAFNKIQSLTFPNGVVEINGDLRQLYNKGLKTVYIPSSVKSISPHLFDGCTQLSIRCPSNASIRRKIREMGRNPKSIDQEHFYSYKESDLY